MKNKFISTAILAGSLILGATSLTTQAADYKVDVEGAHAFKYDTA
ncbi:hypothetical protein [Pseudoalteromonas denitrificans]|uniref:Uncharacterized protein n=1 Tax=Pseudoalteromonas denitrificans DSM 6059 TaxID=1123010 RepID=A0A1I1PK59_9GAMM|nr:hypothetical protein [Pseudoalteromonas denitrificans]SFD10037.1 hypothetical protein SAMN02745724_03489 [Pseudoalteromonas denitrificans DSM 6059]